MFRPFRGIFALYRQARQRFFVNGALLDGAFVIGADADFRHSVADLFRTFVQSRQLLCQIFGFLCQLLLARLVAGVIRIYQLAHFKALRVVRERFQFVDDGFAQFVAAYSRRHVILADGVQGAFAGFYAVDALLLSGFRRLYLLGFALQSGFGSVVHGKDFGKVRRRVRIGCARRKFRHFVVAGGKLIQLFQSFVIIVQFLTVFFGKLQFQTDRVQIGAYAVQSDPVRFGYHLLLPQLVPGHRSDSLDLFHQRGFLLLHRRILCHDLFGSSEIRHHFGNETFARDGVGGQRRSQFSVHYGKFHESAGVQAYFFGYKGVYALRVVGIYGLSVRGSQQHAFLFPAVRQLLHRTRQQIIAVFHGERQARFGTLERFRAGAVKNKRQRIAN